MTFHKRFDINVGFEEAQRRFVNRVYNQVILDFLYRREANDRYRIETAIASGLGDRHLSHHPIYELIGTDFLRNLQALEAIYEAAKISWGRTVDDLIRGLLYQSEIDLGVEWRDGKFYRKGAALLDQKLVNDVMHWLRGAGYESVFKPFEKGLGHLLEAHIKKEHISDVITDMYEAVEALAKNLTGRDKDLSGNRELFLSKVKASDAYKALLKDYIDYANNFRHAEELGKPKPIVSEREVESFVYLTGLFIRLAMP